MTNRVNSFRKVLTNTPMYTLGDIVQRGIGILLLPLYTRYLETSEYGAAILANVLAGFVEIAFSFHLRTCLVRFAHDAPDDKEYLGRLYGTVFGFVTLLSAVLLLASIPLVLPVIGFIGISEFWIPYVYLTLLLGATSSFFRMLQRVMQADQNAKTYVIQQWAFLLLGSGTTIILMVQFSLGGLSIVIGATVASVSFFFYTWVYLFWRYNLVIDRSLLRDCLAYSLPLLPNGVGGALPRITDRIFLSSVSVGVAGVYSAGYRFGEALSYLTGGFFTAHLPWFYSSMGEGESGRKQIVHVGKRAVLVVSVLALFFALFAEEAINFLLGVAYHESWKVVPLAAFYVVFNVLKDFWLKPLTYKKSSTRYVPVTTYTFALLSILFTAWMVPIFGMMGAAGAILIARFLSSFIMLYFSLKQERVGYPIGEMYGIAIGMFFLSLVAYLPVTGLFYIKLTLAVGVTALTLSVCREECRQIVQVLRRRVATLSS